ncbi:MAG: DDE-type integrase/transposase/recombinase [Dehalococcoidales bacterium]|nr:DDE-type integrase/transposase/recombinase [Dehalococcoidales bacterium]
MEEQQALEIANFRYRLISPIVSRQNLPPGQIQALINEAAQKTYQIPYSNRSKVSVRSIERYLQAYRKKGFEGLKPRTRTGRQTRIPEEYLKLAALMKKENPRRSCEQIIKTLELSGKVPEGVLKRSTVYDYLDKCELTRRFTQKEHKAYMRYQARHRNQRWIGDTCQLIYLADPDNPGKKKKVYLIAWLDDFSRVVTHAQCYWAEKLPMLEDSLKKAVMKYGLPEQIYVDLAKIYTSRHLETICGKLGIQRSLGRPYRPAGRGKVERLFATIQNSFLPELYVLLKESSLSLDELNDYLWLWLDKYYHEKVHSATKQTPRLRFESDSYPLRTISLEELYDAFLLEEKRTVDKTMVFSIYGRLFQTVPELVQKRITVRFDPYDLQKVQVHFDGRRYPDAEAALVPEHAFRGKKAPKLPEEQDSPASGLNFLTALKSTGQEGLSYSKHRKEDD